MLKTSLKAPHKQKHRGNEQQSKHNPLCRRCGHLKFLPGDTYHGQRKTRSSMRFCEAPPSSYRAGFPQRGYECTEFDFDYAVSAGNTNPIP